MSALAESELVHRYTVDEYEALAGHPSFEDKRVELIQGIILDMTPRGVAHENVVAWLNMWLANKIDPSQHELRACLSLRLADSEPEPDLAVVDRDRPRDQHPASAQLVIEVAVSSLRRDLTLKPEIYAPAVMEYWVVNLEQREVVVHRDPGPDGYRQISVHRADESVAPQALASAPMSFAELFAAA